MKHIKSSKLIIIGLMAVFLPFGAGAQKRISDKSKQKQVKSMEYLDWNFEPAIYYGWFHNDYSGAKSKFLGLDYSFHEDKSNIKRAMWVRSENLGLETLRIQEMQASHEAIRSMYNEEIYLQADRLIDLYYDDYKDEFEELRLQIEKLLSLSMSYSNGKFSDVIIGISMDVDVVNQHIELYHKTGPGYEMESVARKEGYEQALADLKKLRSASINLYRYSKYISYRK